MNDVMSGSDRLGFLVILKKNSELSFGLRRSELIFGLGWGQSSYGLGCWRTRWLTQWVESWRWTNNQHRKIVSLSPRVVNLNLKKVIKFRTWTKRESSVFRVFRNPLLMNILWTLWTFHTSLCFTYSHYEYVTLVQSLSHVVFYIHMTEVVP